MIDASVGGRGIHRAEIVAAARRWVGTPYRHQASLAGIGCDCLGLLRGVWREVVGDEPERAPFYDPSWAELGRGDPLIEAARRHLVVRDGAVVEPGMILIFRWRPGLAAKHCGIATAPDRMVHAHDGATVAEVTVVSGWRRRIAGVFDFPFVVD